MIHTISLDAEIPRLHAEQLERLSDSYLADQSRRNQPSTVKGYRFKLKPFLEWWRATSPGQEWILSADDLPIYEQYLNTIGWGYNSRRDAIKRLKQMLRWAHRRGHIPVDFSLFVPRTAGAAPIKLPLTLANLAALLQACWRTSNPIRNQAIIAILAGTGLRREECASLRIQDVTIFADSAGYLNPQTTKNDKPRLVAFDAATGTYIRQWVDILNYQEGPLFPSRKGSNALSPDGLYKVILDTAKLAGIDVQTHDLRRMFATTWSRQLRGDSYGQLLQIQLGHASYNTTVIYSLQQIDEVLHTLRTQDVSPLALLNKSKR